MIYHDRPLEFMYPHGLGIILDSDGVIVDSEAITIETLRRMYAEVGIELNEDDIYAVLGRTAESSSSMIWERYGYFMNSDEFNEREQRIYLQLAQENGLEAFSGAEELLEELDGQRIPYALASSSRAEKIEINLAAVQMQDRFPIVVSGDDVAWGKPDPEILVLAASRLALPPERCISIEDSIAGVEAARRAGMTCIAITNTFTAPALSGADCVVRSIEDINSGLLRKLIDSVPHRFGRT